MATINDQYIIQSQTELVRGRLNLLDDSTLVCGGLAGSGVVNANNSTLMLNGSASTSDTVDLTSSHLVIASPALMHFMAPINMDAGSTVTVDLTGVASDTWNAATGVLDLFGGAGGHVKLAALDIHSYTPGAGAMTMSFGKMDMCVVLHPGWG
jgi:hypothetical protein